MKSRILVLYLLAATFSAGAAVSTNSVAAARAMAAPGMSQSRLTSAATVGVVPTNAYPLKIVTCREDVDVAALVAEFEISLSNPIHLLRNLNIFIALLDDAMIQKLKTDPRVIAVEADGPVVFAGQWIEGQTIVGQYTANGLLRLGIPQFPTAHLNGATESLNVDVAVLDSGVGPHEDLNIFTNYSVYDDTAYDQVGHGTEVAGVLGALDNGIGVVGAAPGVRIWNIQCVGPPPNNAWANFVSGVSYVLQHSNLISVANMSVNNTGATAPVSAIRAAVRSLVRAGIVVVVAAGNGPNDLIGLGWDLAGVDLVYGTGDDSLPASLPFSMAVSAMDASIYAQGDQPRDQIWAYSNYSEIGRTNDPNPVYSTNYVFSTGGTIDVAAPGVNILTTAISNSYAFADGTSFAAPHVAGLVALYIAANGRATNEAGVYRIRQAIVDNAQPQSQWHTNNTLDPDTNPEPLAIASGNWIPKPVITNTAGAPGNF